MIQCFWPPRHRHLYRLAYILDVVVVLLENKTENKATSNGIWITCVWATVSDTTRNWPAGWSIKTTIYKQLHISHYFFNEPHHRHLGIDQQVGSIKTTTYKQLHIAQYFFNEPHHEYKLFILQYSIHPPATLLYFLRTLKSQLCSPCLVNQKSGI
jgi:hypothetical protein